MRGPAEALWTAGRLLGILSLLMAGSSYGAERLPYDVLIQRISDLEARVKELEAGLGSRPGESDNEVAARRLVDAQVLYTLRNYEAAATILFDVVDRYPKAQVYPDALFYLGDALFHKRDYLASRRFFEKLADGFPQHQRAQEALLRLVETALHLQAYEHTEKWLERLAQIPKERALAQVPYVRGKYHFIQKDYDKAIAALTGILPQSPYYLQARYFIGASHVARGQTDEALSAFAALVQATPRTDAERRIIELGHLALGRIYYDQGQTTRAHEEYLQISQKSDLFPDALYESAWVAIKSKDYRRALRQLELLVLAQPDSLTVPEAKLLMGSLQIRLNEHQPATKWFQKTRDEFQPVQRQLEELLQKNADPQAHFREQIRKNLDKFDVSVMMPKVAARFVRTEKEVERFSHLAGDVSELHRSLKETEETLQKLEQTLAGPQRFRVDPHLASVRESCLTTISDVVGLSQQLADAMMGAVSVAATADELRQLREFDKRRDELEKELSRVVGTLGSKGRAEMAKARVNELDKRAAELTVHLQNLRNQRAAIEKYYANTKRQQKIREEQFQKELAEVTAQEAELTRQHEQLRRDLADAMALAERENLQVETSDRIEKDYAEAVRSEQALMDTLRQRLTGPARVRADQIWTAFDRTYSLDQRLHQLMGRLNQLLDQKVNEAHASLLVEKENLKQYRQALAGCSTDTEEVGGGLLTDVIRSTARRFYDIVVRSDIGIIDVAWAAKQQRTDKISRLVREQKRELRLLDDEFKEVLKEQ
jgi:TolA-binding protein